MILMKRKIFSISLKYLADNLKEGAINKFKILKGLPEDSKIIGIKHDPFSDTAKILVESDSFELVQGGEMIPEGDAIVAQDLE